MNAHRNAHASGAVGARDRFLGVDFDRAFEALSCVFDLQRADELFPVRGNAVYGTSVVLWMLVYQRMSPDAMREAAVQKLLETRPGLWPANSCGPRTSG